MADLRARNLSGVWRDLRSTLSDFLIVAPSLKTVSVTKALAAADDYGAEDVLSELASGGTAWKFPGMGRVNGGSGYITKAQVTWDTTALTPRIALFVFSEAPTSVLNDNVANTGVLRADVPFYQGPIDLMALSDLGGDSEATVTPSTVGNLPLAFKCADDANDLYILAVLRDAVTGEAAGAEMTITLTVEQT